MRFKLISLGCKVNFYENNALREMFLLNNYVEDNNNPDVVVINTCSVTKVADQKSRQIIRREKRKNPNSVVVVMGCSSQNHGEEILSSTGADIVIGTSYRNKLLDLINEFKINNEKILKINKDVRHLEYESFNVFTMPKSTRAYIKVEDGCNNFCTYCTIPYTRGEVRSRNKDEIIAEITHLVSLGFKEFVLCGIHTAHYGLDLKDTTFSDLVEAILNIEGLYRLRISSIEESEIDDKFITLLANYPKLANHLHMPLQSGSKTVLKRMGRKYNVDDFIKKVEKIRSVRPDISITTDVIVGFPGESEEEFKETYDFIDRIKFSELHVFPFSAREGTKAYLMDNQISPDVKSMRVDALLDLSKKLEKEYYNRFLGQELEVILEERNKKTNLLSGFTSNYLKLSSDLSDDYIGKIVKLKVR